MCALEGGCVCGLTSVCTTQAGEVEQAAAARVWRPLRFEPSELDAQTENSLPWLTSVSEKGSFLKGTLGLGELRGYERSFRAEAPAPASPSGLCSGTILK